MLPLAVLAAALTMPVFGTVEAYKAHETRSMAYCLSDAKENDTEAASVECRQAGWEARFIAEQIDPVPARRAEDKLDAGWAYFIAGASNSDVEGMTPESQEDFRLARHYLFSAEMDVDSSPGTVKKAAEALVLLDGFFSLSV
jgi:hypothetical protein